MAQHREPESTVEYEAIEAEFDHRNHYDITGKVLVASPRAVRHEISGILRGRFPDVNLRPIYMAFDRFVDLYTGELPSYFGCETWYHDARHSLDCALAMARLVDGYERRARRADRLGERRALLGVIAALFHDAGYIRKTSDEERHGAEFTLYHVQRSGDFLSDLLPRLGLHGEAPMVEQLVHFTGYEISLDKIQVEHSLDRRLGFLLGTADLLSQMSDPGYPEKLYHCLYAEFEIAGLAGRPPGVTEPPFYASPEALIRQSPAFINQIWRERLDDYFEGVYRHLADHFRDRNPYLEAVKQRVDRLEFLADEADIDDSLRRRVCCINAGPLRVMLGLKPKTTAPLSNAWPPPPRFAARSTTPGQ